MIRRQYTFICALCGVAETVTDIELYERLKFHRREHYGVLKNKNGSFVGIFFDPDDETDSWFNLLLTWKLQPKESNGAEGS